MSGQLFERVHICLTQLLSHQKSGYDVRNILVVLSGLIEDGYSCSEYGLDEKVACRSAVTVAMKIALDQAMKNGSYKNLTLEYATFIGTVFSLRDEDQVDSIKWAHIKPILTTVILSFDDNTSGITLDALMGSLESLLEYVASKTVLLSEFFSIEFLHGFGKLIATLLTIVTDENKNHEIRLRSITLISRLHSLSAPESLAVVLPGLLTHLCSLLTNGIAQSDVIMSGIEILFSSMIKCLSNDVWKEAINREKLNEGTESTSLELNEMSEMQRKVRGLCVDLSKQWIIETATHVKDLLVTVAASLCASRHVEVRLCFLNSLFRLDAVENAFGDSLHPLIADTSLLLSGDEAKNVAACALSLLSHFRSEHPDQCSIIIHQRFADITTKLPIVIKDSPNCSGLFDQLAAVLRVSASDRVSILGGGMRRAVSALSNSLRIDRKRLLITKMGPECTLSEIISSLPLQHGVQIRWVLNICTELAKYPLDEMLDIFADLLNESASTERTSLSLMLCLFLKSLEEQDLSESKDVLRTLVECQVQWLDEVEVEPEVKDDVIEDASRSHSPSACLALSLLTSIGYTLAAIKDQRSYNLLLVDALSSLLEWSTVTNFVVASAAQCTLDHVAQAQSVTVSELLSTRGTFIVNKISLYCRDFSNRRRCPVIIGALVERVSDSSLYSNVKHVADQLMSTLDRHNQEWTILILRALSSFVEAIARWYPDMRPKNEDPLVNGDSEEGADPNSESDDINDPGPYETEKAPIPEPVKSTEAVLLRTKHLLSSPHFPVRLLVLRTLSSCLTVVRYFDDVLLPMVHQNWAALKFRLEDEQMVVRIEAVKTLSCMCEVAGSFVYRRVKDEAWGAIARWMDKQTAIGHYSQTAEYRLMGVVLDSIPSIFLSIGYREEDYTLVCPLLEKFLLSAHTSQDHKAKAENVLEQLHDHLSQSNA